MLVTQHFNGCCHSFSGLHLGLHKPPKTNLKQQKKQLLFYRNCLIFMWCHQKTNFIPKWLYIIALKNRNKRNLPLLLHLISAPFCSVSQSRVPTLLQRHIIIVIYKWELQSYFFIISSIRHFTASSKPFLIPCDNP